MLESFLSLTQGKVFGLCIFVKSDLKNKIIDPLKCNLDKNELKFKWLMFDFDNTLVDFHDASKKAFTQCFIDYGIAQEDDYYTIYGAINAKIWKEFEEKKITAIDIRQNRFTAFLEAVNIENIDGLEFNTKYLENLIQFTTIRPEVKQMLTALKNNYKLSIITNGLKEVQRPRLKICEIDVLFDSIIVSDEIGVAKPEKAFFDFAISTLNETFSKDQILVIGDSASSDIEGAKRYGLKSCFVNKRENLKVDADIEIADVLQLKEILDQYIPVDCGWYDYLEIYSMRQNTVEIEYESDGIVKKIVSKISNLVTRNRAEYAILSNNQALRLDRIRSISLVS